MKKGENIFKRKDGRWEARYSKGYELSGKIKFLLRQNLQGGITKKSRINFLLIHINEIQM